MLLKSGGRIVPSAAKFLRSLMPGPYQVMIAKPITDKDLDELAQACAVLEEHCMCRSLRRFRFGTRSQRLPNSSATTNPGAAS